MREPQTADREPAPFTHKRSDVIIPLAAAILHLCVSVIAQRFGGISIYADPARNTWEYFWQVLPVHLLRDDLWESLLYMHTQPPLFNLWGALWMRLVGDDPLWAMQAANTVLGMAISAAIFPIARSVGAGRTTAAVLAFGTALLPSLTLYEAYPLYEVLTLFWVTMTIAAMALYQHSAQRAGAAQGKMGWLLTAVACVTALVLTRSSYHFLLIALVVAIGCLALRTHRRRFAMLSLCIALPMLLWVGKNALLFGIWLPSSWQGMSLWNIASQDWSDAEIETMVMRGVVSPMVALERPFQLPSVYAPYGYDQSFDIAALNENILNNGNMLAVTQEYRQSAVALLLADPGRYARNVLTAYTRFSRPTTSHDHLESLRAQTPSFWLAAERTLYGLPLFARFGSVAFWLFPLGAALFLWLAIIELRRIGAIELVRKRTTLLSLCLFIAYAVAVSSLLEYGENERFRFAIEPLSWVALAGLVVWARETIGTPRLRNAQLEAPALE